IESHVKDCSRARARAHIGNLNIRQLPKHQRRRAALHLPFSAPLPQYEANITLGPCKTSPRCSVSGYLANMALPQTRDLTQFKFTHDGDILFSVAKDQIICAWFSANGERLGTYHGHQGAIWTVDVDPTTTFLASGAADNTIRLWEVKSGKLLK